MSNLLNYVTDYGVYFTGYADGVSGDLQYGDRIAAVNGVEVSTLAELKSAISSLSIGDTVTLTVARLSGTSGRNAQSNMIDVKATLIEKGKTTTSASAETSVQ